MMMFRLLIVILFLIVAIAAPHSTRAQDPAPEPAEPSDSDPDDGDDAEDGSDAESGDEDGSGEHPGVAGLKKVLDTVVFQDVTLRSFAMSLAAEYQFNVVIYADIPDEPVSLNLRQVPVGVALAAAARAGGCEVAIDSGIAFVWPARVVKPAMKKQVYHTPENAGPAAELGEQLKKLAGTDGVVLVGPNGRVIFVIAVQDAQDSIARYLTAIATRNR